MTKVPRSDRVGTDRVSAATADLNTRLELVEQTIWHAHRARRAGDRLPPVMPPKPSALRVAVLRAAHQLLDDPVVFDDPLALSVLGPEGEEALRSDPTICQSPPPHAFRAALILRSKVTEDMWTQVQQAGAHQYVILGAGLDTFAYRNPNHGCRVFEVDLPEMIEWKRECLRMAGIQEPDSLTFVPTDFESDSLGETLNQAGLDPDSPAFFSWLGVTFYLDEDAIMHTLSYVGSLAPGSGIVFDYAVHPNLLPPQEQEVMERIDKRMSDGDEPWKTHLNPDSLPGILLTLGFSEARDLSPEELNDRYMSGRTDGMRKTGLTRIIFAQV